MDNDYYCSNRIVDDDRKSGLFLKILVGHMINLNNNKKTRESLMVVVGWQHFFPRFNL